MPFRPAVFIALFGLCFARLAAANANATATPIRVACVGDSITYGYGLMHRDTESYPAVLGRLLGADYEVRNFGVSGATLLKGGSFPYWQHPAFQAATDFAAQIVIIKLGTNDAATRNWQAHGPEFAADAAAFLAHFRDLPSKPAIWVCLPMPVFGPTHTVVNGPRPEIRRILADTAQAAGGRVIDAFTPFAGHAEMFADGLHPDAAGAALLAKTVAGALKSAAAAAPAEAIAR
jgi:lysophospholipase L1-like esterase